MRIYTLHSGDTVAEVVNLDAAAWLPWGIDSECRFTLGNDPLRLMPYPALALLNGGELWVVLQAFTYRTAGGEHITVPRGLVTDGASIPKMVRAWFDPWGDGSNNYGVAALIHDWLYAHRVTDEGRPLFRGECDDLLREVMLYLDCDEDCAETFHTAVSAFGGVVWDARKPFDIIP